MPGGGHASAPGPACNRLRKDAPREGDKGSGGLAPTVSVTPSASISGKRQHSGSLRVAGYRRLNSVMMRSCHSRTVTVACMRMSASVTVWVCGVLGVHVAMV